MSKENRLLIWILVMILSLSMAACSNKAADTLEQETMIEDANTAEESVEIEEEKNVAEDVAAKAAEEEAAAYYGEGRACLYGLNGYETDYEAAYTNFEKALELGKTEANFYLGVLCDWYGYPEKDYEKARAYYEAAGDNPYAQLSLGYLYHNGQGVEADTEKARELFEAVIAEDCVEGYLGRGEIAITEEDYDAALECFNKALEGEEQIYIAAAMFYIANMYQNGQGVEQDYAKAIEWYEKAADLGDSNAMCYIAYMYEFGQGTEQDLVKSMEWYEKSANLGNTAAMNNLGSMYFVTQAYAKALGWYKKAANSGDADAMNFIADMYEYGYGVARNSEMAQEWRGKAEAVLVEKNQMTNEAEAELLIKENE